MSNFKPSPQAHQKDADDGFALPHPALLERLRLTLTDYDYTTEFERLKLQEPGLAAFYVLLAKEVAPDDLLLQERVLRAQIFGHLAISQQSIINSLEHVYKLDAT
jgi:hypothetical protein